VYEWTLKEECTVRLFENRVIRKVFGLKKAEVTEKNRGSCIMMSFIICTHPKISLGRSSQGE
jgi:hypothetical protein